MSDIPTTAAEVCERVRSAIARDVPLQPIGGGAQIHIGEPGPEVQDVLSTRGLNGIVEYSPADMVIVAQAGVTLSNLQAVLAEHGQWLPIQCAQPQHQTLGGIVSTRAASLCRAGYGSVRDWLIGIQVVGGSGQLIRGGGRVVKNVSGYDLPKLYCGAWGTLGIVTETAFKVAPIPERSSTVLSMLSPTRNSEEVLDSLLAMSEPVETTLINPGAASLLLGGDAAPAQYLVVRIEGAQEAVAQQSGQIKQLLEQVSQMSLELPAPIAEKIIGDLRDFALLEAPLTSEFHILSSQVGAFSRMLDWTAARWGFRALVAAECRTGVLHVHILPGEAAGNEVEPASGKSPGHSRETNTPDWVGLLPDWTDKAARVGGSCVLHRIPELWRMVGVSSWSALPAELSIMRGIKNVLDPGNIFNRGRFLRGL